MRHMPTTRTVRVGLAQIDPTVGDLRGNSEIILAFVSKALSLECDVVCFPELALTGYPPEDLLLNREFIDDSSRQLNNLARKITDIVAIVGCPDKAGGDIYNSAAVVYKKKIIKIYRKNLLPNYGVFDEKRYFQPGGEQPVFYLDGACFGVNICEDIWHAGGPSLRQARAGAGLIINISASPYDAGKTADRLKILRRRVKEVRAWVAYLNLVGGQDELVFDGNSMAVNPQGKVCLALKAFEEDFSFIDIPLAVKKRKKGFYIIGKQIREKTSVAGPKIRKPMGQEEEVYSALVLGLKDYVIKNGFKKAVIGLSGGIDSALTAAIASDALGAGAVTGILMPSEYTSGMSIQDARALADVLGMRTVSIPIDGILKSFLSGLSDAFDKCRPDATEENLQARIRGNILMAFSNKFGWLVLSTGNKSEVSTGYCTLYGDMAGGLDVLKDVPKCMVYKLARYRNSQGLVIPERSITREPSAELRPNQKDSDTLPAYDVLDPILREYVERGKGVRGIIESKAGFAEEVVRKVARMVDRNEYKRRQAALGIKITPRAFGKDRRMPVTNGYQT